MIPECVFCRKSPSKQWNETAMVCDIVTDPLGFSDATEYIIIYFRFYVASLDGKTTR